MKERKTDQFLVGAISEFLEGLGLPASTVKNAKADFPIDNACAHKLAASLLADKSPHRNVLGDVDGARSFVNGFVSERARLVFEQGVSANGEDAGSMAEFRRSFAETLLGEIDRELRAEYDFRVPLLIVPAASTDWQVFLDLGRCRGMEYLTCDESRRVLGISAADLSCGLYDDHSYLWLTGKVGGYFPHGRAWKRAVELVPRMARLAVGAGMFSCDYERVRLVRAYDREETDAPVQVWYRRVGSEGPYASEDLPRELEVLVESLTPNWPRIDPARTPSGTAAAKYIRPNPMSAPFFRMFDGLFDRLPERSLALVASEWFLESGLQAEVSHRIVFLATAFESLFYETGSKGESGRQAAALPTRVGYSLGKHSKARARIQEKFYGFYDLRSRIVHQGRRDLTGEDAALLSEMAGYFETALVQELTELPFPEPERGGISS